MRTVDEVHTDTIHDHDERSCQPSRRCVRRRLVHPGLPLSAHSRLHLAHISLIKLDLVIHCPQHSPQHSLGSPGTRGRGRGDRVGAGRTKACLALPGLVLPLRAPRAPRAWPERARGGGEAAAAGAQDRPPLSRLSPPCADLSLYSSSRFFCFLPRLVCALLPSLVCQTALST
eukprot:scaffold62564_cov35-Tisochrysis_lutea.AAC.1